MHFYTRLLYSYLSIIAISNHVAAQDCPDYSRYSTERHEPFSSGKYALSYQRPTATCRTFNLSIVESTVERMTKQVIKDPDLARLFENTFPNTLDTAVRWRGTSKDNGDEELAFIITGDIDAMWLRDSTNQLLSYRQLLTSSNSTTIAADSGTLASLYRGVINLQARYLLTSPYCNSFQPPAESGISPTENGAAKNDQVKPTYNTNQVFECKYELDSLAAFLQLSDAYYTATNDANFFSRFNWAKAVDAVLKVADSMQIGTYREDGSVADSAYTFQRENRRATETFTNDGLGSPVKNGTGLIRSGFRPSDDSCTLQLLVPSNMMFSRYLAGAARIAEQLSGQAALANRMKALSEQIRAAIGELAVIPHPKYGSIYAYEIDGYGGAMVMDDANIPSLLSAPFLGFLSRDDETYQNTRRLLLSADNPYFMRGPVINAIGGPHTGPGNAWPMANIMRILTTDNDQEIINALKELVSSTDQLGLMHESINSFSASRWSRQWFSWANGLFGEMILDLNERKPAILQTSFQT